MQNFMMNTYFASLAECFHALPTASVFHRELGFLVALAAHGYSGLLITVLSLELLLVDIARPVRLMILLVYHLMGLSCECCRGHLLRPTPWCFILGG